jgi:hypothetical protein
MPPPVRVWRPRADMTALHHIMAIDLIVLAITLFSDNHTPSSAIIHLWGLNV